MCIRTNYIWPACKHAVDRTPNGNTLAFITPCQIALNRWGIYKPTALCEEIEAVNQYLEGKMQCPTCNLDQNNFMTEEYQQYKASIELRRLEEQETGLTNASGSNAATEKRERVKRANATDNKGKRQGRQVWDSFGALIQDPKSH